MTTYGLPCSTPQIERNHLDGPVHRSEPTLLRKARDHAAARGCGCGPQGQAVEPSAGGRALLVAAYWRTNLTMRQLAPLFGVSKSAADRIIDHLGPMLAPQPRKRFAKDTVLIVDGTLVPTRDHAIAAQSRNLRYSTNHQTPHVAMPSSDAGRTLEWLRSLQPAAFVRGFRRRSVIIVTLDVHGK